MDYLTSNTAIYLLIIQQSDIPTLLNLRLVNRATHDLIAAYEASLSTFIAGRNFENRLLLLRPKNHPPPSIRWLLSLQQRQDLSIHLAAISTD